jgi:hypothetical protein
VSPDLPVPAKMQNKSSRGEMTMVLKSAKLNATMADSLFQLPKGTTVKSLPAQPGAPGPQGR